MKQKTTQQANAYKINITQTTPSGTLLCPGCGAKISPDDHSEETYMIWEVNTHGDKLAELVLYCKRCTSFIHLTDLDKIQSTPRRRGETRNKAFCPT
ncbi:MAG: hypothetical protein NWE93_04125 [Candidatus Bathyarchaeota archaeon]|nr:hypothetical protein [Candidatus Bathyarchaeota archaeon]